MKTLKESINEVMNNGKSINSKRGELVKLGLMPQDIRTIIYAYQMQHPDEVVARRRRMVAEVFNFKWGIELETYNVDRSSFLASAGSRNLTAEYQGYNHHDSNSVFKMVTDASICGSNGIECVSPILDGNANGFASAKKCCEALVEAGAKVNKSTGFHVHISCEGMTGKWFANIFKNYQKIERVVDSFMPNSRRANNNTYCHSLINSSFSNCESVDDVQRALYQDRYYKVNCMAWQRHRTIEFRQHSGTTDYKKVENWVKFCADLVAWSKNNVLDHEIRTVDEIPFIKAAQKRFYKARVQEFADRYAEEAA